MLASGQILSDYPPKKERIPSCRFFIGEIDGRKPAATLQAFISIHIVPKPPSREVDGVKRRKCEKEGARARRSRRLGRHLAALRFSPGVK